MSMNNPYIGVINAPYGRRENSGFSYAYGPEGLYDYLNIKYSNLHKVSCNYPNSMFRKDKSCITLLLSMMKPGFVG